MRRLLTALPVLFLLPAISQVGPRTWQDHLSLNWCNSVTKLGNKIYASNYNGLVYFEEKDLAPKKLSKINGLNDVGIRLVRANGYNDRMLVIYDNSNIDVIGVKGDITNYPDIKLKTMSARKIINEATFNRNMAYLACGFGIVVFDTDKLEIKDTYVIGPAASNINVYQVALNDSMLFAATELGMMTCNYRRLAPNNFRNWSLDTVSACAGPYNGVICADGEVLCCYSEMLKSGKQGADTFYIFQPNGKWTKYPPLAGVSNTGMRFGPVLGDMYSSVTNEGVIVRRIHTGENVNYISSFNGQVDYGTIRDFYFGKDHTGNISYWVADARFGLYQTYSYYPYYPQNKLQVNGMNRFYVSNIDLVNGVVMVSPSSIDETGNAPYLREGVNILKDGEWSYVPVTSPDGKPALDVTSVLIDRKDNSVFWATSFNNGLYQFKNNKQVAVFTHANAGIPEMVLQDGNETRSQGLVQDKDGNIWFANSEQQTLLSVLKRNAKSVITFKFDAARFTRKVFIDKNNYVWMLHQREGGITVFKHGNFNTPVEGVNYKVLTNDIGNGNLQSKSVYAIAEDKDGKIWVGTAQGISVFYNPSAIFTGGSSFDSQPIKIVQDGNVELLLGQEIVTCIAVDGANNKWVGTATGGIYCFSPDGIRQLYHFTAENSPLYSNSIRDVNYDETTGDVYIGTELGLQSFRSTIIKGEEQYTDVHAFPNPVKPGYRGSVLVRGLIDNSIVKVVDVAGNLVWETKSTGGQIEWPVTNLSGTRVVTGVYVIYASTTDGAEKAVSKVLVMN